MITLWIEREDFMENPPKKFFRMSPDKEVRLKGAYIVKCTGVKKDENGEIEEIYATCDPESRSGLPGTERKVKGLQQDHQPKGYMGLSDEEINSHSPISVSESRIPLRTAALFYLKFPTSVATRVCF